MALNKPSVKSLTVGQEREVLLCYNDVYYFIENYCKITTTSKGLVPFTLFDYQKNLIDSFIIHRQNIVLKARQLGISTLVSSYALWLAMFHDYQMIGIASIDEDTAAGLANMVNVAYDNLPAWLRNVCYKTTDNTREIKFVNGSTIIASTTTKKTFRSKALSLLIIDEAAHIELIDALWTAAKPTLSCITADTLVLTPNGYRPIIDFCGDHQIGDYFTIDNLEVWGKQGLEPVSHGYVSPESDTFIIETQHGMRLEVTHNHPLYKLGSTGGVMTPAKDLKVGDALRTDFGMEIFGKYEISSDLAYMIGGYIAEGCVSRCRGRNSGIWVSNDDQEFREVFLNNKICKPFKVHGSNNTKLRCYSIDLIKVFEEIGVNFDFKCDKKVIPSKIWGGTKNVVSQFLSGLFDGDGCVIEQGVHLSSTSRRLLQEVQILLLNYGIISNIIQVDHDKVWAREQKSGRLMPGGKPLMSLKEAWGLVIPRSYMKQFAEQIGFRIQRKQIKLIGFAEQYIQDGGKTQTIPVAPILETIKQILDNSGRSGKWFRVQGARADKLQDTRIERNITLSWVRRFRDIIIENKIPITSDGSRLLSELASYNCFWDKIVSITPSKNKTYDFTVPNTHSFLQNGILGSNTGGRCIALSSPNGVGNWFYKQYTKGSAKENNFHPTKLMWNVRPEYDMAWFLRETSDMEPEQIAQEYECSFVGSAQTRLPSVILEKLEKYIKSVPPPEIFGAGKELHVWESYQPGHDYLMASDIARGDYKDFSTCHVFDVSTMEQVAEFKGKVPLEMFPQTLLELANLYGDPMIVVEGGNSYGYSTVKGLEAMGYTNCYYSVRGDSFPSEYIPRYSYDPEDLTPGFLVGSQTRDGCIALMESYLRNDWITINSMRTLEELNTFIVVNKKAQAMKGTHDDLVLPLAFGIFVIQLVFGVVAGKMKAKKVLKRSDGSFPQTAYQTGNSVDSSQLFNTYSKENYLKHAFTNWEWLVRNGDGEMTANKVVPKVVDPDKKRHVIGYRG